MSDASRIERVELGSGVPLLVLTDTSLPLVRFAFALRQGALVDPEAKAGCARMMIELLQRGTRQKTRRAWSAALERLGSQLDATVTSEMILLFGVALKRNLTATLALLAEALLEPAFDEREHEALRGEVLADLASERDDDDILSDLFWRRAVYRGHPLQRHPSGEARDLCALAPSDLKASHARLFRRGELVLAFAGDITTPEASRLAEEITCRFPEGGGEPCALVSPPRSSGMRILVVDKPERTKVQMSLGSIALSGRADAARAFWLGTMAFGGTFTSRLTREVRDLRGWSYFAHASFDRARLHDGPVRLRMAPAVSDALACLTLAVALFRDLAEGEVEPAAIEFAKSYVQNRFPLELASAADLLLPALRHELLGRPPAQLLCEPELVGALAPEVVRAALAHNLDPQGLEVVLVATAAPLLPELLRRFAEAQVEVVDYRDGLLTKGGRA